MKQSNVLTYYNQGPSVVHRLCMYFVKNSFRFRSAQKFTFVVYDTSFASCFENGNQYKYNTTDNSVEPFVLDLKPQTVHFTCSKYILVTLASSS